MRVSVLIIFVAVALIWQSGLYDNNARAATQSNSVHENAGQQIAELNLARLRAAYERQLRDLVIMFPGEITGSFECYQNAISNYVEDKWGNSGTKFVGYVSPIQRYLAVDYAISHPFQGTVGRDLEGDLTNRAAQAAREAGISYSEILVRIIDLNRYLTSCASMKPAEWSVTGNPFPAQADLVLIGQKLGFFHLLLQEIFASKLPNDDKGFVGCIGSLFYARFDRDDSCHQDLRCIETIPHDARDSLFEQLAELKAHDCSVSYALGMKPH